MSYADEWADDILARNDREAIVRLIKCDCVPALVSSKSCRKCGRRAVITQEHFMDIVRELNSFSLKYPTTATATAVAPKD